MKALAVFLGFAGTFSWGPVSVAAPVSASSEDYPRSRTEFPSAVTISTAGGNCPVGFTTALSGDYESITLGFSDFQLFRTRPRLVCLIGLDYKFPAGWRFWRPSVNVRGFQLLSTKQQNAVWVIRSRINGGAWQSQPLLSTGPVTDNFQIDLKGGEAGGEAPVRCGARSARIDVEIIGSLFADSPDGHSEQPLLALDTIDTEIDWQRCQP